MKSGGRDVRVVVGTLVVIILVGIGLLGGIHKLRLQDLASFDHLPPSVYIFYGIMVYKKSIFLTTYVNVVCEHPLSKNFFFD